MKSSRFVDHAARRSFRVGVGVAGLALLSGLFVFHQWRQLIRHHENDLLAAGFTARHADAADGNALDRLPVRRFTKFTGRDSATYYLYADPQVCNCIYVGSQESFDQYTHVKKDAWPEDERRSMTMRQSTSRRATP
jgi:hypothetical protein